MEEKEMSFWGHLEELRRTLFRVVAVLLVFMIACFCVMPDLFDSFVLGPTTSDFFLYRWLSNLGGTGPLRPDFSNDNYSVESININVASQFLTHISTSFWFALVLMFPYLIFEVWRFVQPALFENERRSVGLAFLGGTVMFFLGCAVGYCLVFPFTFRFLTEYQLSASIVNQISLNSYMGNFLMLVFVMGIVFELPLLAWLLSKLGLVNKTFFRTYRRHAVVILLGAQYIRGYIWDCIFAGVHFSFSGYFCAYGRSEISFIHNLIAILCVRIPGVYLTSKIFPDTLFPMGLATATGSLLSVIICMIAFDWLKKQKRKSD